MKKQKSVEQMNADELRDYMDNLEDILSDKEYDENISQSINNISKCKLYEVMVSFGIPVLAKNEKEAKKAVAYEFRLRSDNNYDCDECSVEYEEEVSLLDLNDKEFEQTTICCGENNSIWEAVECFDGDRPTVKQLNEFMKSKKGKK